MLGALLFLFLVPAWGGHSEEILAKLAPSTVLLDYQEILHASSQRIPGRDPLVALRLRREAQIYTEILKEVVPWKRPHFSALLRNDEWARQILSNYVRAVRFRPRVVSFSRQFNGVKFPAFATPFEAAYYQWLRRGSPAQVGPWISRSLLDRVYSEGVMPEEIRYLPPNGSVLDEGEFKRLQILTQNWVLASIRMIELSYELQDMVLSLSLHSVPTRLIEADEQNFEKMLRLNLSVARNRIRLWHKSWAQATTAQVESLTQIQSLAMGKQCASALKSFNGQ